MKIEFPKPKIISFRTEVSDISSSQYLTHSLYYHPAKFIPKIGVPFTNFNSFLALKDKFCPRLFKR